MTSPTETSISKATKILEIATSIVILVSLFMVMRHSYLTNKRDAELQKAMLRKLAETPSTNTTTSNDN